MALYDLSSQPYSVGDMIMFQGIVLALSTHYQLPQVDMGFILNLDRRPVDLVFAKRINPDNALPNLLKILPVTQFNPRLGSVFIWENDQEVGAFLQQNSYKGVWPELGNRHYFFYPAMQLWGNYFQIHQQRPFLAPPKRLWQWAKEFYRQYSLPDVPITVNIRNNPDFGQNRNSLIDVWIAFFEYCAGRFPIKFIVICGITEVDIRLRCLPNVVVAKDQHTTLAQDLALISAAIAHFGTASGPCGIAYLNKTEIPAAIFNSDIRPQLPHYGKALHVESDYVQFIFSPAHQRTWFASETLELLIQELDRIWAVVDIPQWQAQSE